MCVRVRYITERGVESVFRRLGGYIRAKVKSMSMMWPSYSLISRFCMRENFSESRKYSFSLDGILE